MTPRLLQSPSAPRGFTLVESLVALAIAGMAAAVLLLTIESTLTTTMDSVDRTIADGLAQQLLDEILQQPYVPLGSSATESPLGASAAEQAAPGRSAYNEVGDYNGYSQSPAASLYGFELGSEGSGNQQRPAPFRVPAGTFNRWRQLVSVYYVDGSTHQRLTSGTSHYRCIEITIQQLDSTGNYIPLASRKQVIAYVPMP